ncbi:hypothetical protein EDC04DRAFT_2625796, partial [Pisolithus marmoratus]
MSVMRQDKQAYPQKPSATWSHPRRRRDTLSWTGVRGTKYVPWNVRLNGTYRQAGTRHLLHATRVAVFITLIPNLAPALPCIRRACISVFVDMSHIMCLAVCPPGHNRLRILAYIWLGVIDIGFSGTQSRTNGLTRAPRSGMNEFMSCGNSFNVDSRELSCCREMHASPLRAGLFCFG